MAISEHAGRPADPSMLVDVDRLVRAYFEIRPDPPTPSQRVAFGTSGHRGSSLNGAFNEAHIVATTEAICRYRESQGIRWPAVHRQGHARPVRTGLPDGARGPRRARRRRPRRCRRRLHADPGGLARDPRLQPRAARPPRRRHRHHAVAQPARGRRLQVQPARTAARPTPTSPAGSRTRRTGCSRRGLDRSGACPIEQRAEPGRPPTTTSTSYVDDLASVIDMDAIAASGLRLGVDPMGGASVAYWPAIARALRPRPDGHQRRRRPAVRVHDRRLGRPDPDGPVVAVRDGPAGRAARPVRCRLRQRRRRRPPRHRHARRRPDEPEPLPVRRRSRYLFGGGRDWGARRRGRQDAGLERDAGPRRGTTSGGGCSRSRSGSSGS